MYRYFKKIIGVGSGDYIYFWKSKGLSDESIKPIITSDYIITAEFSYKQFLTKSNDIDKYKYSGYGTGFDRNGKFSVDDEFGRNCIIFGVGMSSSVNLDNKKKSLHLGAGPTQGLDGTALTAEKMCSINFTKNNKIFV